MADWRDHIEISLTEFLNENDLRRSLFGTEYLPAPHRPPSRLPAGKVGIYCFWLESWGWLKIGMAGPNSQPRWTSHHYWGCALSTLAGSLRSDPEMAEPARLDRDALRAWIIRHTCRANILMPSRMGRGILLRLEGFLHARLNPRYEGGRRGRPIFDLGGPLLNLRRGGAQGS